MQQHGPHERPFPMSKDLLDTLNSVTWFAGDALWMLKSAELGYFFMGATIVSGLCLLYIDRRPPVFLINCAINSWIWMNTLWMISEREGFEYLLDYSRAALLLGASFIVAATLVSKSFRETFSHFRRFRGLPWKE